MTVLVINQHGNVDRYGSNNRHFKIGKELSDTGIKYTLVSSSLKQSSQNYIHTDSLRYEKLNENFTFVSLKSKPKYNNNFLRFLNYLDFTFKASKLDFKEKPEHIVGSSVHPFTWVAAYKLSKKYNASFHIEIRDIWPLSLYEDLSTIQRFIIFKLFNFLEKKYYPLAESIIVTAPKTYKYLFEKFKIPKEKVHYVPHSINIKKFQTDILESKNTYLDKLFNDKFNITYAGSLSPSEGLPNLINLAEELKSHKDIRFHIFGGGPEEENLKNLIKEKKLNNIIIHGFVEVNSLPSILSESDILWVGLKERKAFKYGISKNKFFEYIAAKKPIIFHSNVKYSPLNNVSNAYLLGLNQSAKETVLKIKKGEGNTFDSIEFLKNNHSDKVISKKFINALK